MTVSLRERKKEATRDALIQAAIQLFEERGFDVTTVDDIAAAVDVSPRTFHRYFPTKDDVLFADAEARRERFRAALDGRPADEPLLESLRIVVHDFTAHFVANPGFERRRQRILREHPGLGARRLQQNEHWRQMIVAHAAARLDLDPRDPLPELLAGCTVAALKTALDRWTEAPRCDYGAVVDRCFDLLADLRTATTPRATRPPGRQPIPPPSPRLRTSPR